MKLSSTLGYLKYKILKFLFFILDFIFKDSVGSVDIRRKEWGVGGYRYPS